MNAYKFVLLVYRVFNSLGSGNFGKVLKGIWHSPSGSVEVAIKTLHAETTAESTIKFLQEACIMQQFDHRNILKLHGIFKTGDCYFNGAVSCHTHTFKLYHLLAVWTVAN